MVPLKHHGTTAEALRLINIAVKIGVDYGRILNTRARIFFPRTLAHKSWEITAEITGNQEITSRLEITFLVKFFKNTCEILNIFINIT